MWLTNAHTPQNRHCDAPVPEFDLADVQTQNDQRQWQTPSCVSGFSVNKLSSFRACFRLSEQGTG